MHPRSKHWHLLDYVITRKSDLRDILDTRAMRGADCSTDHMMLRTKVTFSIKKKHSKSGAKPPTKLNVTKLKDVLFQENFAKIMDRKIQELTLSDEDLEESCRDRHPGSFIEYTKRFS